MNLRQLHIDSGADWSLVPEHIRDGIRRYVEQHEEQGSFLMAVLRNDLSEAVGHADGININHMREIMQFIWMYVPALCWGTPEHVTAWLAEESAT